MSKINVWASFKVGKFTIKYSKSNKTWQVLKGQKIITDYNEKESAKKYAEIHNG